MAIPDWPATLPQSLQIAGYDQSVAAVTLRTAMDAGPPKQRRRFTAGVEPITGKLQMTFTQLGYLRTFYDATLLGGTLRFAWKDPITEASAELRFTKVFTWVVLGGTTVSVTMPLEILP